MLTNWRKSVNRFHMAVDIQTYTIPSFLFCCCLWQKAISSFLWGWNKIRNGLLRRMVMSLLAFQKKTYTIVAEYATLSRMHSFSLTFFQLTFARIIIILPLWVHKWCYAFIINWTWTWCFHMWKLIVEVIRIHVYWHVMKTCYFKNLCLGDETYQSLYP